jgi:lipopolysaccharide/colanic/teichoic acid biosynthesis glycosyltransferase
MSLIGLPLTNNGAVANDIVRCEGNADLGPIGITGIIQVHQYDGMTMDEMRRYALYYVSNHSLALDVEILAKTLGRHG